MGNHVLLFLRVSQCKHVVLAIFLSETIHRWRKISQIHVHYTELYIIVPLLLLMIIKSIHNVLVANTEGFWQLLTSGIKCNRGWRLSTSHWDEKCYNLYQFLITITICMYILYTIQWNTSCVTLRSGEKWAHDLGSCCWFRSGSIKSLCPTWPSVNTSTVDAVNLNT